MKLLEPEFKHNDIRRTLTQLLTADIKQINVYHANRGAVLGDHFHKQTVEYFYLVRGTILYNETIVVNKNNLFVVYPEEKHSVECLTDVTLMTFLTKSYDNNSPDLHKESK